jgi:hypothetical protein
VLLDPDQKEEKLRKKTRKNMKISIFYAVPVIGILGKEFGLKMFNVRKIR